MKKVTLFVLHSEQESALSALRDLGVMQITLDSRFSASSVSAGENLQNCRRVLQIMEQTAADHKLPPPEKLLSGNSGELIAEVDRIYERLNQINTSLNDIRRRLEMLSVWGDFDRSLLDKLQADGVNIVLCLGGNEDLRLAQTKENIQCYEICRNKGKVAFALVALGEFEVSEFPTVELNENDDPRQLKKTLAVLEKEERQLNARIVDLAGKRSILQQAVRDAEGVLEFCRVRDAVTEHDAIVTLSGFVPAPEMDKLAVAAGKNGWGFCSSDPAEDDEVPVLLENNRFTRIIKPLFDFLGIVPGYREIDISGAVLIFFTVFYAIILGDAGYGILFGVVSGFGLLAAKKVPKLLPPMRLLLILSIAATIWGALCGSWFGLSVFPWNNKPIPALECFRDFAASSAKQANIQFFCFVLAVIQLSVGRIWRVIRERNWRAAGQHLGWTLIIWGNFFLTIRLIVYPGEFPSYMYALYGVGLLMVMGCGVNWKQASDVFQFPFDIIGSFTDVLSYIRLFAVGLAGACIAGSFNGMAFDLAKVSAWLIPAGVLVALVGHALNIALALLSVLVHAVRLNTLEFSNHTGLSWSGQSFNPFKSNNKEEETK
ncbi:MAG: hypothetical protein E7058_05030 [Lentisphaerae bacterium]|nr:hypothetical protein [Lentisphaerota bacterium]